MFDVRVFIYRCRAFDKYSSATTPAKQAFMCHRHARAGDFARFIFSSSDHRPASTRVAPPSTVPRALNADLERLAAHFDSTSMQLRSPSS